MNNKSPLEFATIAFLKHSSMCNDAYPIVTPQIIHQSFHQKWASHLHSF
jgi:hypothetical protein